MTCSVTAAPGASVPSGHVTVPEASVQGASAETKLVPAASGSLTTTFAASDAPLLRATRVYVISSPLLTAGAEALFTIWTSADGSSVVVTEAVFGPGPGSGVGEAAVTVFVRGPVALAG